MTTTPVGLAPVMHRPPSWSSVDWTSLVHGVLREPSRLGLAFQPIVALQEATIVGYEALARFAGPPGLTPDQWFAAADRMGCGAQFEALVVDRCLALRGSIPADCFLTLNLSPHLIGQPEIADRLFAAGDLRPLVLELTEHQRADLRPLSTLRDRLAAQGALIALDDAGAGYSGLQQLAELRPHLVKLDRSLVAGADSDEIKLALAELLGQFAGRIDAWLLAEGVETWAELEAFLRLGVPLAQGFLLGRPAPPWARLDPVTAARLRNCAARASLVEHAASLVELVPVEGQDVEGQDVEGQDPVRPDVLALRLDDLGRPVALLIPQRRADDGPQEHRIAPVSLRVPSSTSVVELAQRLVARPEHCRFDPVVCIDERGRAIGVIRLERVLLRLAELKTSS